MKRYRLGGSFILPVQAGIQEHFDVFFKYGFLSIADVLAPDFSRSVNNEGCGEDSFCIVLFADVFIADKHCIIYGFLLEEWPDVVGSAFVEGNGDYPKTLVLVLVVQLDEMRYLGDTAGAPGCPEGYDNYLVLEIREADLVSVHVGQGEWRGVSVVGLLFRAPGDDRD